MVSKLFDSKITGEIKLNRLLNISMILKLSKQLYYVNISSLLIIYLLVIQDRQSNQRIIPELLLSSLLTHFNFNHTLYLLFNS